MSRSSTVPGPVSSVRLIPRPCSCTWRLTLGNWEAAWTRTEEDPGCKMHGAASEPPGGPRPPLRSLPPRRAGNSGADPCGAGPVKSAATEGGDA